MIDNLCVNFRILVQNVYINQHIDFTKGKNALTQSIVGEAPLAFK